LFCLKDALICCDQQHERPAGRATADLLLLLLLLGGKVDRGSP
jgi:hypothetical protein